MGNNTLLDTKIKKSNILIMAHFKMTIYEQKIVLLCISKIKKDAKKTNENDNINLLFNISAKEIIDFLRLKSRGIYTELNNIANRLTSHKIYIDNGKEFRYIVPIPFCEYKDGVFNLRFDISMQDYLLELTDKFTVYDIENIRNLKYGNSIRIYEILKSYEWLGDCSFDLIDFKDTMGFIEKDARGNVINDMYKPYSELKRKVLKLAQDELLQKTDIEFNFEEIKIGKKVSGLRFTVYKNPNFLAEDTKSYSIVSKINLDRTPQIDLDDLIDQLQAFISEPIKIKDLKAILKAADNDVKLIQAKYELAKQQPKIDNLTAWLITAIKDDYAEPVTKQKVNRFVNYEQESYDFDKLEQLERERIKKELEKDSNTLN